jgi:replicative DNA helicase
MSGEGAAIDVTLLAERLKQAGDLEAVGGPAYLSEVLYSVPVAAHAVYYAKIVRKKAQYRRLRLEATELIRDAQCEAADPAELAARTEARLSDAIGSGQGSEVVGAEIAVDAALAQAEKHREGKSGGLMTGFYQFDHDLGGLFYGELVILAARPRMGKTSMGCQIATHTATTGRRVLFCSLEMAAAELTTRMMCSLAGVDGNRVRTGNITDAELDSLREAGDVLRGTPLFIWDRAGVSVADIRRRARLLASQDRLSLVIIDYLQRLLPADPRAKRYEQVGQMASDLKRLARDLELPVLCLAQLNRQAESTSDHRPRLAHLRESGDIEQDADQVLFLHRPEVHQPDDWDLRGQAVLIVSKNRNGPTGEFNLVWDAPRTTFRAVDTDWSP